MRRLAQHRDGPPTSFTRRYAVHRVVHVEWTSDISAAIAREKQIKRWSRSKKIALIEAEKPNWDDLSECWGR
jgi:putative endonuclease